MIDIPLDKDISALDNAKKYFEKYIEIIGELEKDYKEKILKLLVDVKNDNPKRFGNKIDMLIERTE